ncbi:Uncharacterised protein [Vibrio cholerae]|nr:Uncharacterised protein [Vibrio cholerae]
MRSAKRTIVSLNCSSPRVSSANATDWTERSSDQEANW